MIHIDFVHGPKIGVLCPTYAECVDLFQFLRAETDVRWAGGSDLLKDEWNYKREATVYLFGSAPAGMQIVGWLYFLEHYSTFTPMTVESFISLFRQEEDTCAPDIADLL